MMIQRIHKIFAGTILLALLAACAHPISITAESTPARVDSQLISKKVAYVMTDADRNKEVITPGGGGDRISYYPYRDLEKSIRNALRSIYVDVAVLRSASDLHAIKESGADLIFTPEVKTTSSSSSALTWPPTRFSTEISCLVTDPSGHEVTRVSATGEGVAEFSEFKTNFGLAGNRASTDAAAKLAEEIRQNEKLR